jgi:hypothetical protein
MGLAVLFFAVVLYRDKLWLRVSGRDPERPSLAETLHGSVRNCERTASGIFQILHRFRDPFECPGTVFFLVR